jgi:signal transduction histidine kinase
MVARHSAVRVDLDVRAVRRLLVRIEVAAYYIVSEALTNAAKSATASVVHVDIKGEEGVIQLSILDDGVAEPVRTKARDGSVLSSLEARKASRQPEPRYSS